MTDRSFQVEFGPVVVRVSADEPARFVHAALERWLASGVSESGHTPDVSFELTGEEAAHRGGGVSHLRVGGARVEDDRLVIWDGRAWEASAPIGADGASWRYRVRDGALLRAASRAPQWLLRLAHHHYFSSDEIRASTFLYRHLIPIVQTALVANDASFIHASSLRHRDGRAMLISGWGGSGKTSGSTWLYLTHTDEWQFLGDDLSILDARGKVHLSPLALNVFPYNTARFEALRAHVMNRMGVLERAQWHLRERLLGEGGVVRRLAPDFGRPVETSCPVDLCVHLQRSGAGDPVVRTVTPTSLSRIAKSVLLHELRHSHPMFALANAVHIGAEAPLPPLDELLSRTGAVLARALDGKRTLVLDVPHRWEAAELGSELEALWTGGAERATLMAP